MLMNKQNSYFFQIFLLKNNFFIQLPNIKDGVILHGLYMEAFRWDAERKQIADAIRGEMIATLPMLHMEPRQNYVVNPTHYIAPLYKTAARAGVLSTTGK